MLEPTLSDQIEMLRVHLENALAFPIVLVISSARAGDGKTVVASEIARSMDAAGYSTLLVRADEETHPTGGGLELRSIDDVSDFGFGPYVMSSSRTSSVMTLHSARLRSTVNRLSVSRFAQTCRAAHQVTVIETAAMLDDSFAMLAGMSADGVLLTIREGRRVCAADRTLASTLTQERIPFLGVVTVAPAVIRNTPFGLPRTRVVDASAPVAAREGARREQAV